MATTNKKILHRDRMSASNNEPQLEPQLKRQVLYQLVPKSYPTVANPFPGLGNSIQLVVRPRKLLKRKKKPQPIWFRAESVERLRQASTRMRV
jgi:hypothetical protein